jgi:hypothetical protein
MTTQWSFVADLDQTPLLWSPILDVPQPSVEPRIESVAEPSVEPRPEPFAERRRTPAPSAQLAREHQRLMAQTIALKAHNHQLVAQREQLMTRISQLSTQNDTLRQQHDRGELQVGNLQRQLDRQRQRANIALDVQPVHAAALSNPNPAVRNARGHYVQLGFWQRKQHRPIVRTCLSLVAASLVVGLSYALLVLVVQLLSPLVVPELLLIGFDWGRLILAIDLVSLVMAMLAESA